MDPETDPFLISGNKSIKDIQGTYRSPRNIALVNSGGEILTLDNIEHRILRPVFKHPDGPFLHQLCLNKMPLGHEAYEEEMENKLADPAEKLIDDVRNSQFRDFLYLSRIFYLFRENSGNEHPVLYVNTSWTKIKKC